jgi:hypothetical protein
MSSKYICRTRFESNYSNCTGKSSGKITGEIDGFLSFNPHCMLTRKT